MLRHKSGTREEVIAQQCFPYIAWKEFLAQFLWERTSGYWQKKPHLNWGASGIRTRLHFYTVKKTQWLYNEGGKNICGKILACACSRFPDQLRFFYGQGGKAFSSQGRLAGDLHSYSAGLVLLRKTVLGRKALYICPTLLSVGSC